MKVFVLLFFVFTSVSCASYFKRKECEKTNWYNHGKQVALKGIRVDADEMVNSCQKVEANINWAQLDLGFKSGMAQYCTDEGAKATGRKGDFLNLDLCDQSKATRLKGFHKVGVSEFCQFDSAVQKASTGWVYNNICPQNLEANFMRGYKKGRKNFLQSEIQMRQSKIRDADSRLRNLATEKRASERELSRLSYTRKRHSPKRDNLGKQVEDPVEQRRREVRSKISSLNSEISRKRNEKSRLKTEIIELQREMRAL